MASKKTAECACNCTAAKKPAKAAAAVKLPTQNAKLIAWVNEIKKLRKELYEITAFHTGKTPKQVEKDSDRDYWLTALEAKEYGLVDEVLLLNPRKETRE